MFKLNIMLAAFIFSSLSLTACGPSYTPEQIAQMQEQRLKMMEQYRARLQASQQTQPNQLQAKKAQPVAEPKVSEQRIAEEIAAIPVLGQDKGVLFERKKDGFTANGERYIDYEGEIDFYAFDGATGNVTYAAEVDDRAYIIKFMRAGVTAEPITIGHATKSRGTWKVRTVTGKRLSGESLLMTSKGFVVVRHGTGFFYEPGQGIINIAAPDGFNIAKYQVGDIASTRHILVERIPEKEGSLGDLWSATKAVGGMFGGDGNQDYALLNIQTKKITPLLIGYSGNKGRYDANGMVNSGHYYWRTEWFKVSSGTYVVYVENGIQSAKVIHLETGLEKEMFHRALGINSVHSFIQQNGKIKVIAKMGFGTESVDDLEKFMLEEKVKVQ